VSWHTLLTGAALVLLTAAVGVGLMFAPSRRKRAAVVGLAIAVLVAVVVRGG
jgi:hypothetical protein